MALALDRFDPSLLFAFFLRLSEKKQQFFQSLFLLLGHILDCATKC